EEETARDGSGTSRGSTVVITALQFAKTTPFQQRTRFHRIWLRSPRTIVREKLLLLFTRNDRHNYAFTKPPLRRPPPVGCTGPERRRAGHFTDHCRPGPGPRSRSPLAVRRHSSLWCRAVRRAYRRDLCHRSPRGRCRAIGLRAPTS